MGKKDAALSGADTPDACVLYRHLTMVEREGTVFFIGGKSGRYERCAAFTEAGARELVARLSELLADLDAERSGGKVVRLKK